MSVSMRLVYAAALMWLLLAGVVYALVVLLSAGGDGPPDVTPDVTESAAPAPASAPAIAPAEDDGRLRIDVAPGVWEVASINPEGRIRLMTSGISAIYEITPDAQMTIQ